MSSQKQLLLEKNHQFTPVEYKPNENDIICTREELDNLNRSVEQLGEITRDLCGVINTQNEQIDTIGNTTENTLATTELAQAELSAALAYQNSNRNRMIAFTVMGAGAGILLFSGVGTALGVTKAIAITVGAVTGGAIPHAF